MEYLQPICCLNSTFGEEQNDELVSWYAGLDDEVKAIVRPVNVPTPDNASGVEHAKVEWNLDYGYNFLPSNFNETDLGAVVNDVTTIASSGSGRAFALSMADVVRLSGSGRGFPNHAGRVGNNATWWWLRTLSGPESLAWNISVGGGMGRLLGHNTPLSHANGTGGTRPALIIHQTPN